VNLPTSNQVNAATRHAASFAAGAVAMFGLSSKIDPQTLVAIINSAGTLINDGITLVGLATPIVAAWYAQRSARPDMQKASVVAAGNLVVPTASPAAAITVANAIAALPEVKQVVSTQATADATPSDKVVAKP
jgi:hypothetical protein